MDLVSLKDGLDLATPAGRLMANVLASVAAYETEVRAERIMAGQAAAREAGKTWGGSPKGRRLKVTAEQEAIVRRLEGEGAGVSAIARATGLSRPTIYRVLGSEATSRPARGSRRARKAGGAGWEAVVGRRRRTRSDRRGRAERGPGGVVLRLSELSRVDIILKSLRFRPSRNDLRQLNIVTSGVETTYYRPGDEGRGR